MCTLGFFEAHTRARESIWTDADILPPFYTGGPGSEHSPGGAGGGKREGEIGNEANEREHQEPDSTTRLRTNLTSCIPRRR